jgi:hypothetical protein
MGGTLGTETVGIPIEILFPDLAQYICNRPLNYFVFYATYPQGSFLAPAFVNPYPADIWRPIFLGA